MRKTPHGARLLTAGSRRIGNSAGQDTCPVSKRKRKIVMTQTTVKTTRADQFQGDREAFQEANGDTMHAPKRLARIAGVLYLLVGIFGAFAQGFVYTKIYVAGNAATTAGNVIANSELVRLGVVADLIQATIWVFLGMTLYLLL